VAEILHQMMRNALNGKVTGARVALVRAQLLRCVAERVEGGVERVDLLEGEHAAGGEAARLVELAAFEEIEKDVERGRPCADDDRCARLRERLRDRKAVATIIRHPR